jgi:hypothetical protein
MILHIPSSASAPQTSFGGRGARMHMAAIEIYWQALMAAEWVERLPSSAEIRRNGAEARGNGADEQRHRLILN